MTTNRPPNVSSYYDGRDGRSSNDANQSLSAYQQNQSFPRRERVDSSSSSAANYSNNRLSQTSQDLLTGEMPGQQHLTGSGGYNRNSFFPPTSEAPVKGLDDLERQQHAAMGPQDDGWDVYADFNNTGPRYSVALGGSTNSQGYRQLPAGASKPETPLSEAGSGPVELVTVPALGAEWQKSELRAMTKSAKREQRMDKWTSKWKAFRRDENGFCCIPGMSRVRFVIILFILCVIAGIILAFTIPRVPGWSFNNDNPINGSSNIHFARLPANFTFDTNLNLQINTQSNFLPLTFNKIHATIFDSDTNKQIGEGEVGHTKIPAKAFFNYQLPVSFSYSAINDTDITWNDVYKACQNPSVVAPAGANRPPLKLKVIIDMSIAGLIGHPTASTAINNAACPFELPTTSI